MKQNYLLPAIQEKLETERKYVSSKIVGNPRITEVNNVTAQYVKNMGNLFMYDRLSFIYERKFNQMMDFFLGDPHYIESDTYDEIQINLPEYGDGENDITEREYLKYQVGEKQGLLRTREKVRTEKSLQERLTEQSIYDEFGIEIQRETTEEKQNSQRRRVRQIRLPEMPHIIQIIDLDTGKEKYIDIRNSEHFEDLNLSNATQVEKEEITDLTQIERIRIAERTSNSVYGEGIKSLLGMQTNIDQVSHGEK